MFGALVESPFIAFRKSLGKEGILTTREEIVFHKSSVITVDAILTAHDKPEERRDFELEQPCQTQYDMNKAALASVADCIIYLGRQCSALHAHPL